MPPQLPIQPRGPKPIIRKYRIDIPEPVSMPQHTPPNANVNAKRPGGTALQRIVIPGYSPSTTRHFLPGMYTEYEKTKTGQPITSPKTSRRRRVQTDTGEYKIKKTCGENKNKKGGYLDDSVSQRKRENRVWCVMTKGQDDMLNAEACSQSPHP